MLPGVDTEQSPVPAVGYIPPIPRLKRARYHDD